VVKQTVVLRINICGENPPLRQATKRCAQAYKDSTTVKNLLHKDKEKENHPTLRHIWLPLRTGDRFAAKRAFVLPTYRLTVDNSYTFYNEI
jgi:hypothetical protein